MNQQPPRKTKPDIREMTERLRRQACEKLKLDFNKLTPAETIRADRFGINLLRLTDDHAAMLRGEKVNLDDFNAASKQVEADLNEAHHVERAPEGGDPRALRAVREKMAHSLGIGETWDLTDKQVDHLRLHELADLENEIFDLKAQLEAQSAEKAAKVPEAIARASETPQEQPAASNNVVPIRDQLPISPLVIGESASIFEQLNRKAW